MPKGKDNLKKPEERYPELKKEKDFTLQPTQYPEPTQEKETAVLAALGDKQAQRFEAETLIAHAIDKGVGVETMERLLVMRTQLKQEYAKEQFDKAMAFFQRDCPVIEKTKQGYNYKYAPLESIVGQVKGLLSQYGFSYTFDTEDTENAIIVRCLVKHIAGHSEISQTTIHRETTTKMNASQQSGAAMTYGKRYAFCNAFGILTSDEDSDASDSSYKPQEPTKPVKEYKGTYRSFDDTLRVKIINLLHELGVAPTDKSGYEEAMCRQWDICVQLIPANFQSIADNLEMIRNTKEPTKEAPF